MNFFKEQERNDFTMALLLSQEEDFFPKPSNIDDEEAMSYQVALQLQKEEEENHAGYLQRVFEEEDKKQKLHDDQLSFNLALLLHNQEKEKFSMENDGMDTLVKELEREYEEDLSLRLAVELNEDSSSSVIDEIIAQELQAEENRNYGPGYWTEPLFTLPYRRVRLSPQSKLYTFVQQKFSPSNYTISFIEYIQNEIVWNSYQMTKLQNPSLPEVYRFHGTPHTNVDGISQHGFLTSKDVARRGTTIWSAEQPMVSVRYAQKGPAPDGTHFMFLAKVLSSTPANVITVKDGSTMYPEFLIAFKLTRN